jgi:hypothetical protein
MNHGDLTYPVIGETDATSGETIWALKVAFPMLPEEEIAETLDKLRDLNDIYGALLSEQTKPA